MSGVDPGFSEGGGGGRGLTVHDCGSGKGAIEAFTMHMCA